MEETIEEEGRSAVARAEAIIREHANTQRMIERIKEYPKKDLFVTKTLVGIAVFVMFYGILEAIRNKRKDNARL